MDVKLVMFKANGQRKDFNVEGSPTVIGRGEDCDLQVPLLSVSRRHCELAVSEDELTVKDLGSSNGTYVNNERVNETSLDAGDRLVVGPIVFTVQIDGVPTEIRPVKTRGQKLAEAGDTGMEQIVDLEADIGEVEEAAAGAPWEGGAESEQAPSGAPAEQAAPAPREPVEEPEPIAMEPAFESVSEPAEEGPRKEAGTPEEAPATAARPDSPPSEPQPEPEAEGEPESQPEPAPAGEEEGDVISALEALAAESEEEEEDEQQG